MDKHLKKILSSISFEEKYMRLFEENKLLEGSVELTLDELKDAIDALEKNMEYQKKEKFFRYISKEKDFHFQLNIAISDTRITFILYVENKPLKIKTGGPYPLFAKRLNKKLRAYHKIPYNNFDTLVRSLKVGFDIFENIKQEYLTEFKDE